MKKFVLYPVLMSAFIFMLLFSSCEPEVVTESPVENTTPSIYQPFDVLWSTPITFRESTLTHPSCFTPVIRSQNFICGYYHFKDVPTVDPPADTIVAFNIHTGKVAWKWTGFSTGSGSIWESAAGDDFICVSNDEEVVCLNAADGTELTRRRSVLGIQNISVSENIIFDIDKISKSTSEIHYFDRKFNRWKTALTLTDNGNNNIVLNTPMADILPGGDTLLYFQKSLSQSSTFPDHTELYCYNMTTKTRIWQSFIHTFAPNLKNPPFMDEKYIYLLSLEAAHCFNKKTGATVWTTSFHNAYLLNSYYLLKDDLLVIGYDARGTIALWKKDGKIAYQLNNTGKYRMNYMVTYKNLLINDQPLIAVYDLYTGTRNMVLNTTVNAGWDNPCLAIDENTGLIYILGYTDVRCIRVQGI